MQYAVGTGIFVALCLWSQEPLWVLPVYGIFLAFLAIQILSAKRIAGIMPGIIVKYRPESRNWRIPKPVGVCLNGGALTQGAALRGEPWAEGWNRFAVRQAAVAQRERQAVQPVCIRGLL